MKKLFSLFVLFILFQSASAQGTYSCSADTIMKVGYPLNNNAEKLANYGVCILQTLTGTANNSTYSCAADTILSVGYPLNNNLEKLLNNQLCLLRNLTPGGGGGTVTSFSSGNYSPLFTTSVATNTTTPALSFTAITQNNNLVYAGPVSGGPSAPTFRSLVAGDIPSLNYLTTADNGLTANTATNVQLGGTLLHHTFINGGAFQLILSSTVAFPNGTLNVSNSGTGAGIISTSSSYTGVAGISTTNTGLFGSSVSSYGLHATSTSGTPGLFGANPASTNTVYQMLQLQRLTSGTAATGLGMSIDFELETNSGTVAFASNKIVSKWTDAIDATRTSEFSIFGTNNAVTSQLFTLPGSGQLQLNNYGAGTFTGTPTFLLATDASGNIIETAVPSGATPTLQQVTNAGYTTTNGLNADGVINSNSGLTVGVSFGVASADMNANLQDGGDYRIQITNHTEDAGYANMRNCIYSNAVGSSVGLGIDSKISYDGLKRYTQIGVLNDNGDFTPPFNATLITIDDILAQIIFNETNGFVINSLASLGSGVVSVDNNGKLGWTAPKEDAANKVNNYTTIDAVTYPTTNATMNKFTTTFIADVPTVNDDDSKGYRVGSRVINQLSSSTYYNVEYLCLDASTGAAVWQAQSGSYNPTLSVSGGTMVLDNDIMYAINGTLVTIDGTAIVDFAGVSIAVHAEFDPPIMPNNIWANPYVVRGVSNTFGSSVVVTSNIQGRTGFTRIIVINVESASSSNSVRVHFHAVYNLNN